MLRFLEPLKLYNQMIVILSNNIRTFNDIIPILTQGIGILESNNFNISTVSTIEWLSIFRFRCVYISNTKTSNMRAFDIGSALVQFFLNAHPILFGVSAHNRISTSTSTHYWLLAIPALNKNPHGQLNILRKFSVHNRIAGANIHCISARRNTRFIRQPQNQIQYSLLFF